MLTKTQALVLKAVSYADNKYIVDLLTDKLGRLSVAVAVSGSPRAKFKRSLFQPLMLVDVVVDYRQNKSLQTLRSVAVAYPYQAMMFSPAKMSLALFLSEFLSAVTRNEQENHLLYSYVAASLQWLDAKEGNIANFHLVFMMRLAQFVGFAPNTEDYVDGCYFDLRSGTFQLGLPPHADVVRAEDAAKIKTLLRMDYDNMHLFVMTRGDRNRLVDVLLKYYAIHVPNFPQMRTLDVLRELFA